MASLVNNFLQWWHKPIQSKWEREFENALAEGGAAVRNRDPAGIYAAITKISNLDLERPLSIRQWQQVALLQQTAEGLG